MKKDSVALVNIVAENKRAMQAIDDLLSANSKEMPDDTIAEGIAAPVEEALIHIAAIRKMVQSKYPGTRRQ